MKWKQLRNATLFFGGLAGVLHETLLQHTERPTLLILFAAMMGLPAFLGTRDDGPRDQPPIVIFKDREDEEEKKKEDE